VSPPGPKRLAYLLYLSHPLHLEYLLSLPHLEYQLHRHLGSSSPSDSRHFLIAERFVANYPHEIEFLQSLWPPQREHLLFALPCWKRSRALDQSPQQVWVVHSP
jgi:hypothetical protein